MENAEGQLRTSARPPPRPTDSNCHFNRSGCSCYCPPSMMRTTPVVCATLPALASKMLSQAENCLSRLNPEILSLRSNEILIHSAIHSPRPSLQFNRKNLDRVVRSPSLSIPLIAHRGAQPHHASHLSARPSAAAATSLTLSARAAQNATIPAAIPFIEAHVRDSKTGITTKLRS